MLFKILAIVAMVVVVYGAVFALNRLMGGRLPKWVLPLGIASVIFGYQVFDEYSWAGRKLAGLAVAEGNFVVVATYKDPSIWRPWGYIKPSVARIDAVNTINNKYQENGLFSNLLISAHRPSEVTYQEFIFDCANQRYQPDTGQISDNQWGPMTTLMASALCTTS